MEILSFQNAPKIETTEIETEESGLDRITALRPALRDQNRVNVFIDNRFAFSLDLTQVVDFKLKVGLKIPPEKRRELESASEFGKLYASTLEWVLTRPRSVKETRDHLTLRLKKRELENKKRAQNREKLASDPEFREKYFAQKARERESRKSNLKNPPQYQSSPYKITLKAIPLYTEDDIEKTISRLLEKGYLNDEKFARFYIENRNLKKGISRRQLSQELAQKGIERGIINELLENSSRSEEEEVKKIILKKSHKLTPEKLTRYLLSKGFPYDLVKSCLENTEES